MSNEKLGMAMREKYWSERNADEKIQALYNEVTQMRHQLTHVSALLEDMLHHSHADGKLVAPIDRNRTQREYYVPRALRINEEPIR